MFKRTGKMFHTRTGRECSISKAPYSTVKKRQKHLPILGHPCSLCSPCQPFANLLRLLSRWAPQTISGFFSEANITHYIAIALCQPVIDGAIAGFGVNAGLCPEKHATKTQAIQADSAPICVPPSEAVNRAIAHFDAFFKVI